MWIWNYFWRYLIILIAVLASAVLWLAISHAGLKWLVRRGCPVNYDVGVGSRCVNPCLKPMYGFNKYGSSACESGSQGDSHEFALQKRIVDIACTASLRCYKGSLDVYLMTSLESPLPLLYCLEPSLPTVVYTFGYTGLTTGPATTAVLSAYIATKKRNVVLLDWEEEAKSGMLGLPLGYVLNAMPNAKKIGRALGDALSKLSNAGLNMNQVHLVGHSLGAHVMAHAGRRARANGHIVDRITGLDPARILFEGELALQSGLDRTCAKFVDIIHTDPGGYGTSESKGTVDIWPNYFDKGGMQPGCPVGNYDRFSKNDLCNHHRSWRYFVEALSSPTAFPATPLGDYMMGSRRNRAIQTIYLGDLIDRRARGDYFLTTRSRSPYGRYEEGLKPDPKVPKKRWNTTTMPKLIKFLT